LIKIKSKPNSKKQIKKAVIISAMILAVMSMSVMQPFYADSTEDATATIEFTGGGITMISVPSFHFGVQSISAAVTEYNPTNTMASIEISDLRGKMLGWNLTVSLSPFKNSIDAELETLKGAYIDITPSAFTPVSDEPGEAPTAVSNIQITADNTEFSVASAGQYTGKGNWQMNLAPANVKLVVLPGSAYIGNNTADLTWTLQAAP